MDIFTLPEVWDALPELKDGDIHLWLASLNQPNLPMLKSLLAPDELQKATRFYFAKDKNAYIAARGLLRKLLASYLNRDPAALHFDYNTFGKPFLPPPTELTFNLSHSFELVLYAVGRNVVLGVDIEHIRPVNEFWDIARGYFSKNEVAMLQTVPEGQQLEAFYNCWTRKEAFIKAKGEGLSMPLNQFDVTLIPGEPARLLETRGTPDEAGQWQLESFIPQTGYVAALAWMKSG